MAESESRRTEDHYQQLNKRIDALTMLVEYIQKEMNRLSEESGSTKTVLTELKISMATFNDSMDRHKILEQKVEALTTSFVSQNEKFDALKNSMGEIRGLLWALAVGMLTVMGTIGWDVIKNFVHFS